MGIIVKAITRQANDRCRPACGSMRELPQYRILCFIPHQSQHMPDSASMKKPVYLLLQLIQYVLMVNVIVWLTVVGALTAHSGSVVWKISERHGLHTVDLALVAAGTMLLVLVSIRYLGKIRRDMGTFDSGRSERKSQGFRAGIPLAFRQSRRESNRMSNRMSREQGPLPATRRNTQARR